MKRKILNLSLMVSVFGVARGAMAEDTVAPAPEPAPATEPAVAVEPAAEAQQATAEPTSAGSPAEVEPGREGRKMDLRVAAAPAPVAQKAYVHEGFYLRVGVGPGLFYSSLSNNKDDTSGDSAAFGVAANALVGGSPAPGLALGLGALAHIGAGASFDGTNAGAMFHLNVGPFFDAFPNRKEGFHMGVLVGGSTLSVSKSVSPQSQLWGGGGTAWLGWDTWVAPEWSVGVQLQTGGSYVAATDVGSGIFHANLMVTILNH